MDDEREPRRTDDRPAPLAVENADMPQSELVISEFGDDTAKRRAVAFDQVEDQESGDVEEQRAYLRWEARVHADDKQ